MSNLKHLSLKHLEEAKQECERTIARLKTDLEISIRGRFNTQKVGAKIGGQKERLRHIELYIQKKGTN